MIAPCKRTAAPYRPNKVGFLVRVGGGGELRGATHIWDGTDTACRMWSTGGLNRAKTWEYHVTPSTHLCANCVRNQSHAFGHDSIPDSERLAPFRCVGAHFHDLRERFVVAGGSLRESPF